MRHHVDGMYQFERGPLMFFLDGGEVGSPERLDDEKVLE